MSSKFLDKTGLDTLWAKIKSTFQTLGNLVTAWGSTPSDTKYPSEKLVKTSLDEISTNARTIPQDISKGANLVVNGSGRMSSNYNFSGFTYLPTICYNGSAGSFGFNGTNGNNEFISCDFNKKIVFSADIRNLVAQPSNCVHRIYVSEYDIDKKSVNAIHVMYGVGTLTELTQDLNPGDTVVHLADLSNANWLSSTSYHRGFIFWNYQNSYGYLYPPETYSRNVYPSGDSNTLWDVANVNVSAGTITLNSGWAGPAIPAGTKVSRRSSGGSYPYPAQITTGDTEWHSLKGYVKGIVAPGTSEQVSTKFSQGTAFIKVGMYTSNLTNTDPVTGKRAAVTNFFVYEEQDINDGFGTLPVNRGGTGKTSVTAGNYLVGNGTSALTEKTPVDTANTLLSALPSWTVDPTDGVKLIRRDTGGSASFGQVTFLTVWNYIKSKISSVLGLTATDYGGNAATATTATTATSAAGYTNDGAIATALGNKQDDLGIDSSSGDTSKFLNEKGQWAKPDNDCIVMIQTTATSAEVDDILNDGKLPVLVVGSGSTANYYQFMKVTSGAYIFGRVIEDYIYTYTLAAGTWTLSSVQLAPKTNGSTPGSSLFYREDGTWQVPPKSLQYWSGGSANIKGVYIGTCNLQGGVVGWITGTMSVSNYYDSNPTTASGKGIALGSFYLWAYRVGTTVTASCRLYSLNARHTNTDLILVYKKDTSDATTYKVRFYVCFGPGVTGGGTSTNQRPFGLGISYLENHNADIPESLTGITNDIQYDDDYYSILKMPYLAQGASGVGGAARPVYVNSSGQVTACNDAKFYSSGWNEIDYNYRSHFVISSSQNGRGFTIDVTKLAENVSYELGAVLVDSGNLRFQLKFKKTSSNYYLYGCRNNGTNLVSADVETTNRPEDNVRVVRIGTNVYVIGY